MKIALTNAVTLNGGDAAIALAAQQLVQQAFPGATCTILDSQAEVAARYHPDWRYAQLIHDVLPQKRRRLQQARVEALAFGERLGARTRRLARRAEREGLSAYADADLVISTGGTYLVEHYDIRHRLFELELCGVLDRPVVFFTQSLGPFHKPEHRQRLRKIFARSPLVLLRDERSRQHLLELGVAGRKLEVVADAVFALADSDQLSEAAERELPTDRPLEIALSVRDWAHFRDGSGARGMASYCDAVAQLLRHLVTKRRANLRFVSTCQGIEEYWTHDSETAARICASLPEELRARVTIDRAFYRPLELSALLGEQDLVVATRMHMAILALIAGTPVLPIAYEFKTEELFTRLGAGDLTVAIEDCQGEALVAAVERLLSELPRRRAGLMAAVEEERKSAASAAELLKAAVRF